MMKPEWILIANATRARLLQRDLDLTSVGLVGLDQRVAQESAH